MMRYLVFFLALMLVSCSRGVEQSELPGQYEFALDNVRQQVTIDAEGKYVNALYRDGVLVWSDQGKWTYEKSAGKNGIAFTEFRFGILEYSPTKLSSPEYSGMPKLPDSSGRGLWYVVPEKTLTGTRELCFDPDLDRCFQRSIGSDSKINRKDQ